MIRMMNKKELIDFEKELVERYLNREIRSPVHLSGGNEEQLIKIFRNVKPEDWIFSTYRSHYHALLKGVSRDWLLNWVLDNKSIHVMNKEHKIVTSSIVGGTISQAVGTAIAIKQKNENNHVWVFIGDMAASIGVFQDCLKYSVNNKLPIKFIIENNGLSTDTPSHEAWNMNEKEYNYQLKKFSEEFPEYVIYYEYKRIYPHYGIGRRIDFETGEIIKTG